VVRRVQAMGGAAGPRPVVVLVNEFGKLCIDRELLLGRSDVSRCHLERSRNLVPKLALPEIDARTLSRAVSFETLLDSDDETKAALIGYWPAGDRIAFVGELTHGWTRLRTKPAGERRVALIFQNSPNRDGRFGNSAGFDMAALAIAFLQALLGAGYRIVDAPQDSKTLVQRLLAGPTNSNPAAPSEEALSYANYSVFFTTLPAALQAAVAARWGPSERDPFFRPSRLDCGRFAMAGFRAGNVAVLIQPELGHNIDPKSTSHGSASVPPHAYFATYAWLAEDFRADAVIHLGKRGTLEGLPEEVLAPSAECSPEAVLGSLPRFYPYTVNNPRED
jgi:cobaltochelatase CobN